MVGLSTQGIGSSTRTLPFGVGGDVPNQPCVYFLAADGQIKVGYSSHLASRLQIIRCAAMVPLQLLGWIKGNRALERAIQQRAHTFHLRGEWFADRARTIHPDVAWASDELRKLAGSREYDESIQTIIERVAAKVGASYWRTFDLWYKKARRLEISERQAILKAGGGHG